MTVQRAAGRGTAWWLGFLAFIGAGCLGVGAWRVYFDLTRPPASPVLIVVGAFLLLSPVLIHRLGTAPAGPARYGLRLVQQIADQGAPKTAALLDGTELARLVDSYTVIREELDGDDCWTARVKVQDSLVRQAAGFACRHEFDPAEVKLLFPKAAPVVRVLLVALMRGDPRLLDAGVLAAAIAKAASRNERFHALKVVQWHWPRLKRYERVQIQDSIEAARAVIDGDPDVYLEAEKICALQMRARPARLMEPEPKS
ncbi:hypothetical protein [Actinoplanes sp. DH11]|uniref:hypothetical protein n=1 Tax=Actinoplanes sp. DH11 TaxID=2857011 RepID=UPI001E57EB3B|nr:hypothetical protein [Actinoplanes sp. DH11]